MFYTVYRITNRINSKIYVGVHQTENLDDSYMGSGKLVKRAQAKYGLENFTKEYLAIFESPEEMFEMESSIVNEEFLKDPSTYNLKEGGNGGWDYVNSLEFDRKGNGSIGGKNSAASRALNPHLMEAHLARCVRSNKSRKNRVHNSFQGKIHSAESKARIGASVKLKSQGSNNSQFGTHWITDGISSKKLSKSDPIPDGWRRGRKLYRETEVRFL